jgi:DNA-binding CsgD family transcriptional regulator
MSRCVEFKENGTATLFDIADLQALSRAVLRLSYATTGIGSLDEIASLIEELMSADRCRVLRSVSPANVTDIVPEYSNRINDLSCPEVTHYRLSVFERQIWHSVRQLSGRAVEIVSADIFIQEGLSYVIVLEREASHFRNRDLQFFALVLPHVERALQVASRLANARAECRAALAGLDRVGIAFFVASRTGKLMFSNEAADSYLGANRSLAVREGYICGNCPRTDHLFRKKLAHAADLNGTGEAFILDHSGDEPTIARLVPLSSVSGVPSLLDGAIAVLIRFPGAERVPQTKALKAIYGLTEAEARITQAVLDGIRLQDYATQHNLSINTVKTQLKESFAKVGVGRQAELVRQLTGNPLFALWE